MGRREVAPAVPAGAAVKITAQFALWSSLVFAAICLYVGFDGLANLDAVADDASRSDARGFALFWLFLGAVALACAIASWWILRHEGSDRAD
jgi:hypothetical protein